MINRTDNTYLDFAEQQAVQRQAEMLRAQEAARFLGGLKEFLRSFFTARPDGFRPAVRGIHHTAI